MMCGILDQQGETVLDSEDFFTARVNESLWWVKMFDITPPKSGGIHHTPMISGKIEK
jgi:hypothetical protein